MTAEELQIMRDEQQAHKLPTGVYGSYAKRRDASLEQIQAALDQGIPFVIRLKNLTPAGARIAFHDLIKGDVQMDAYLIDEVLIKKDGLPTYHFAHIVDDKLM
jgi:glutamyl-tRNA synthetase